MKTSKKLCVLIFSILFITGCDDLEYLPNNQLTDATVEQSEELLQNVLNGAYSWQRETIYNRARHSSQSFTGDEINWVKHSGSHQNNIYGYQRIVTNSFLRQLWQQAYYAIYGTNKIIEIIDSKDNLTDNLRQIKGEALFLRALYHYDLVRVFARPYPQSPEINLGVMIKDNTDSEELPARSTVKETFDFIVNDLLEAAELMTVNKSSIYASKEVAWAMLSRLYLYMENNDKAIEFADKVINSGRYELVSTDQLSEYYTWVPENNPETILAIKFQATENYGKAGIGSLYTDDGWGEMCVTNTHRKLIYQNKNDERLSFIKPKYILDEDGNKIPDETEECGYKVEKRLGYSKYFNQKYTLQENIPLLYSPVIIRLAEMYLIKAEAYAKTPGKEAEAIEMVNFIRQRAGLYGDQLFKVGDLKGYDNLLDVVLDERRLELAWEGHRSYDVFRNNRILDRTFTKGEAWAGPEFIEPTDKIIVQFIPESEITLNPNLEQNP